MRFDNLAFRHLIIGAGLTWSAAYVVIALYYQLELYGDGAMFSYAVAVRDVRAFHCPEMASSNTKAPNTRRCRDKPPASQRVGYSPC